MFPVALVCGNTYVIKPSEKDPGACMMLVEMLREAGAPDGVVNVIHGAHDAVNFICDHPDIKAISFVGSDQAVSLIILIIGKRITRPSKYSYRDNTFTNEDLEAANVFSQIWELRIMALLCQMPTKRIR